MTTWTTSEYFGRAGKILISCPPLGVRVNNEVFNTYVMCRFSREPCATCPRPMKFRQQSSRCRGGEAPRLIPAAASPASLPSVSAQPPLASHRKHARVGGRCTCKPHNCAGAGPVDSWCPSGASPRLPTWQRRRSCGRTHQGQRGRRGGGLTQATSAKQEGSCRPPPPLPPPPTPPLTAVQGVAARLAHVMGAGGGRGSYGCGLAGV